MKRSTVFSMSALTMALTLAGCGGGGSDTTNPANPESDQPERPAQEGASETQNLKMLSPTVMDKVVINADVYRPDTAISDNGKALAVWAEEVNGTLRLVAVEGNAEENSWGSKTLLDDGLGVHAPNPAWLSTQVVMDSAGNGVIGWLQSVDASDAIHLKTIAYSPDSGFDAPVDHGKSEAFILEGNDAGDTLIMWTSEFASGKGDIMAAVRPAESAVWEPGSNLTDGQVTGEYVLSSALYNSKIAMNESGEATLLFNGAGPSVGNETRKLQALHLEADRAWAGPETLVEGAEITDVGHLATAIDKTGTRFSGWVQRNTNNNQVFGVTTTAQMEQSQSVEYVATEESLVRLASTYRDDGSLMIAAEGDVSGALYPLITVEVTENGMTPEVYAYGGRYLTMTGDGNRVVTLGRNGCTTGMGVRESAAQAQPMSEPQCSEGNAQENVSLAVTPNRAGVFAGIGTVLDESTFPATRQDVVELTFFR